jgi:hypothetical protein
MTVDEAIEKIKELNAEEPSLGNYHQIMADCYRIVYTLLIAVKDLQGEVDALKLVPKSPNET